MSESPKQQPQSPINPNPNPNLVDSISIENNPINNSQPETPETQNPPPNSPSNETQKNPLQDSHLNPQRSNLYVEIVAKKHDSDVVEQAEGKGEGEGEGEGEEKGINMAPSPVPQSLLTKNSKVSVNVSARKNTNNKRKKGALKTAVSKMRKIEALSEGFNPIPFVPVKDLDFSRYETELRKLELWDFVNLQFDSNLRPDLIMQLVAGYVGKATKSAYVEGYRVKVSRADLARALKLPSKKHGTVCKEETFSPEFLMFLEGLVSDWMLLHDDVWATPKEIVNWTGLIKDGPQKVDFPGLIWFMVEKELAQGKDLKTCYYASHMQQLIKDQKESLFTETVNSDSENQEVVEVMGEDDDEGGEVEMLDAPESSLAEARLKDQSGELYVELRLGQQTLGESNMVEKDGFSDSFQKNGDANMIEKVGDGDIAEMDGDASKVKAVDDNDIDKETNEINFGSMECLNEEEETENIDDDGVECGERVDNSKGMSGDDMVDFGRSWFSGINEGQHIMQPCSMSDHKMSTEDARVEDVEGNEDEEHGFRFMEKSTTMNEMNSTGLLEAFERGHLSYTSVELGGQSSLGLLPPRAENNVMLNDQSMFDHAVKREIEHENDISHHALDYNHHKGIRMGEHWDNKTTDADTYYNLMLQYAEKYKMAREAENHRLSQMLEMCTEESAGKDLEIMRWKRKAEEWESGAKRRDRELHLMNNVINGYRRALKDSQRAFYEFRQRCQIPDEPIYKDAGNGGVVKSIMELEKEQIKQEEERKRMRRISNLKLDEFCADVIEPQLEKFQNKLMSFDDKLADALKEVDKLKLLKDDFVKCKMSKNVALSEEVESEAREGDIEEGKMSEDVAMLEESRAKAQEPVKDDFEKGKMSCDLAMSEEAQIEAREPVKDGIEKGKMSDDVAMLEEPQSESQEPVKDDLAEVKIPEDVMPEEVQNEAQGLQMI